MNRQFALRLTLLALAFALGTTVVGWWAVPLIGLAWGIVGRGTVRPALTAGLSATVAWGSLLLGSWGFGPVPLLAATLGTLTGLGPVPWVAATILFPLSLAWSAATLPQLIPASRRV